MGANEIRTVTVTGADAILKIGTVAKVMNTGHGLWLVLESNGQKLDPAVVFLVEHRDFTLPPGEGSEP